MSTVCPINPPGHDWENSLACRCGATRTAREAIVEGLASRRGGDEAAARSLLDAYTAEVRTETLAEAADESEQAVAAGALRGLAHRLWMRAGEPEPGREAAVRADALNLFLFHLEQSSRHDVAAKLLEDAIEQGGGGGQAVVVPDFFQPGHTYRSDHIRMDDSLVWHFRCNNTTTRHDGSLVAQGPAYWAISDGRPTKGAWMKLTYGMDGWRGGWTDVTEGGEYSQPTAGSAR